MAFLETDISVKVEERKYVFVIIPVAKYVRVGDLVTLSMFGITVYKRVGSVKRLLWHTYGLGK